MTGHQGKKKRRKEFQKQGPAGEKPRAGKRETGERVGGKWGVKVPQRLPQYKAANGCERRNHRCLLKEFR